MKENLEELQLAYLSLYSTTTLSMATYGPLTKYHLKGIKKALKKIAAEFYRLNPSPTLLVESQILPLDKLAREVKNLLNITKHTSQSTPELTLDITRNLDRLKAELADLEDHLKPY